MIKQKKQKDTDVVGITFGTFDLLHPGHVDMLEQCKMLCDWLVVGLHTDPSIERPEKNKPIQTTYERWTLLNGSKFVDEVIPYDSEQDILNMLTLYNIDVRFVGKEYEGVTITGEDICNKLGIGIIYNIRDHNYSSTQLKDRVVLNHTLKEFNRYE